MIGWASWHVSRLVRCDARKGMVPSSSVSRVVYLKLEIKKKIPVDKVS
jgi:hypothetical protein